MLARLSGGLEAVALSAKLEEQVRADPPVFLLPGQHNELQGTVSREFWPRFIPSAKLLYLGDTAKKDWHVEPALLASLGLPFSVHDKYPDLVFWLEDWRWLVLVEAVTTHGPFSPKRQAELEKLLKGSHVHGIYVTAVSSWNEFKQYIDQIAWDTAVWIAEEGAREHMIHFNGSKFLAPLPEEED
jgi:type II restriction enzyme